ncbi:MULTISPECIES: RidA family protein [Campylobacter]|uniref:RidA family protein n=1 Tax=Campylobacter TaxID=194 RepID=UPI00147045EA|nr:Rid family detoxifying hydrolase [Campylobacter sp.]MBN7287318.1 reactive intermediate/imine deaminase [Campylobacter curvus]MDU6826770.1 Rid family detoxifying hydrolase [Campylobacter sp.]
MSDNLKIGPYSTYKVCGDFIFISGQLPVDSDGRLVDGIEAQTQKSLENLASVLEELGLGLANVAKTTCFLSDIANFTKMNEIYMKFFNEPYPARSAFGVKDLPKGALVEIEAIAFRG